MNDGQPTASPGWFPDPHGRYEFRYFNGQRWTADVAVEGARYVDPIEATSIAGGGRWAAIGSPHTEPSGRTPAILALIFGLGALAIAWMPFLFVVGAAGAIASIWLGIVALRRVANGTGGGRGLAIGGIASAVVALALCSVGVVLTGITIREFTDYTDPGPLEVEVSSCSIDGTRLEVSGTITNLDTATQDYLLVVEVTERSTSLGTTRVEVTAVAPGETRSWAATDFYRVTDPADVRCTMFGVNGPFPFGINTET